MENRRFEIKTENNGQSGTDRSKPSPLSLEQVARSSGTVDDLALLKRKRKNEASFGDQAFARLVALDLAKKIEYGADSIDHYALKNIAIKNIEKAQNEQKKNIEDIGKRLGREDIFVGKDLSEGSFAFKLDDGKVQFAKDREQLVAYLDEKKAFKISEEELDRQLQIGKTVESGEKKIEIELLDAKNAELHLQREESGLRKEINKLAVSIWGKKYEGKEVQIWKKDHNDFKVYNIDILVRDSGKSEKDIAQIEPYQKIDSKEKGEEISLERITLHEEAELIRDWYNKQKKDIAQNYEKLTGIKVDPSKEVHVHKFRDDLYVTESQVLSVQDLEKRDITVTEHELENNVEQVSLQFAVNELEKMKQDQEQKIENLAKELGRKNLEDLKDLPLNKQEIKLQKEYTLELVSKVLETPCGEDNAVVHEVKDGNSKRLYAGGVNTENLINTLKSEYKKYNLLITDNNIKEIENGKKSIIANDKGEEVLEIKLLDLKDRVKVLEIELKNKYIRDMKKVEKELSGKPMEPEAVPYQVTVDGKQEVRYYKPSDEELKNLGENAIEIDWKQAEKHLESLQETRKRQIAHLKDMAERYPEIDMRGEQVSLYEINSNDGIDHKHLNNQDDIDAERTKEGVTGIRKMGLNEKVEYMNKKYESQEINYRKSVIKEEVDKLGRDISGGQDFTNWDKPVAYRFDGKVQLAEKEAKLEERLGEHFQIKEDTDQEKIENFFRHTEVLKDVGSVMEFEGKKVEIIELKEVCKDLQSEVSRLQKKIDELAKEVKEGKYAYEITIDGKSDIRFYDSLKAMADDWGGGRTDRLEVKRLSLDRTSVELEKKNNLDGYNTDQVERAIKDIFKKNLREKLKNSTVYKDKMASDKFAIGLTEAKASFGENAERVKDPVEANVLRETEIRKLAEDTQIYAYNGRIYVTHDMDVVTKHSKAAGEFFNVEDASPYHLDRTLWNTDALKRLKTEEESTARIKKAYKDIYGKDIQSKNVGGYIVDRKIVVYKRVNHKTVEHKPEKKFYSADDFPVLIKDLQSLQKSTKLFYQNDVNQLKEAGLGIEQEHTIEHKYRSEVAIEIKRIGLKETEKEYIRQIYNIIEQGNKSTKMDPTLIESDASGEQNKKMIDIANKSVDDIKKLLKETYNENVSKIDKLEDVCGYLVGNVFYTPKGLQKLARREGVSKDTLALGETYTHTAKDGVQYKIERVGLERTKQELEKIKQNDKDAIRRILKVNEIKTNSKYYSISGHTYDESGNKKNYDTIYVADSDNAIEERINKKYLDLADNERNKLKNIEIGKSIIYRGKDSKSDLEVKALAVHEAKEKLLKKKRKPINEISDLQKKLGNNDISGGDDVGKYKDQILSYKIKVIDVVNDPSTNIPFGKVMGESFHVAESPEKMANRLAASGKMDKNGIKHMISSIDSLMKSKDGKQGEYHFAVKDETEAGRQYIIVIERARFKDIKDELKKNIKDKENEMKEGLSSYYKENRMNYKKIHAGDDKFADWETIRVLEVDGKLRFGENEEAIKENFPGKITKESTDISCDEAVQGLKKLAKDQSANRDLIKFVYHELSERIKASGVPGLDCDSPNVTYQFQFLEADKYYDFESKDGKRYIGASLTRAAEYLNVSRKVLEKLANLSEVDADGHFIDTSSSSDGVVEKVANIATLKPLRKAFSSEIIRREIDSNTLDEAMKNRAMLKTGLINIFSDESGEIVVTDKKEFNNMKKVYEKGIGIGNAINANNAKKDKKSNGLQIDLGPEDHTDSDKKEKSEEGDDTVTPDPIGAGTERPFGDAGTPLDNPIPAF